MKFLLTPSKIAALHHPFRCFLLYAVSTGGKLNISLLSNLSRSTRAPISHTIDPQGHTAPRVSSGLCPGRALISWPGSEQVLRPCCLSFSPTVQVPKETNVIQDSSARLQLCTAGVMCRECSSAYPPVSPYLFVSFGISSRGLLSNFMQTDILRWKPASKCKLVFFCFFNLFIYLFLYD